MDEKKEKFLRAATVFLAPAFFIGTLAFHASESYRHSGGKFSVEISDKDFSEISKESDSSIGLHELEKCYTITEDSEETLSINVPTYEKLAEQPEVDYVGEFLEDETIEESSENSDEEPYSEINSSDEDEVLDSSTDEVLDSSTDNDYDAIPYSQEDLFKFEATMTVECGAQGTSREVIIADCWIARNHIEQEIEAGSDDPFRSALNPNHFQPVFDDEFGWRVMHYDEAVTQELIDENPDIHEIAVAVLNGEIPSPIYDWGCCLPYDYFGFDDAVSFAEAAGIEHYIIIENGVFFPASDWTEMCTWFCQNF